MKSLITFSKVAVLLLAVIVTVPVQAQWTVKTSGTTQDLNGVYMVSSSKAFVVGNLGTMLTTNDGGTTWAAIALATNEDINAIQFVDNNTAYASADNGLVLKTIDGGISWTFQFAGASLNLRDLYFIDANTGFVAGENGIIMKTINGGASYTTLTSGTTERLESIFFTSANTGYAVGRNGIYLTTSDGGAIWTSASANTTSDLKDIFFVNTSTGFIARQNNFIQKTTDGGATWSSIPTNIGNGFDAIYFSDINNGRGIGNAGFSAVTANGGTTWIAQATGVSVNLNNIHCANMNACIAVGDGGAIITDVVLGCQTPAALNANSITGNSAILNWGVVPGASSYTITGRESGSAQSVTLNINDGNINSFNATSLARGTSYEWQISANCGTTSSTISPIQTFSTVACATPDPISTTNISTSAARLNWTADPDAVSYEIFGKAMGSDPVSRITVGAGSNFLDVSGLALNTTYFWTIRTICNVSGAPFSSLANIDTFATTMIVNKELADISGISVMPNPASNHINLTIPASENVAMIRIFDSSGKIIKTENTNSEILSIDVSNFPAGVYQVLVETGLSSSSKRLVISR